MYSRKNIVFRNRFLNYLSEKAIKIYMTNHSPVTMTKKTKLYISQTLNDGMVVCSMDYRKGNIKRELRQYRFNKTELPTVTPW
jgi:hypothetical protein